MGSILSTAAVGYAPPSCQNSGVARFWRYPLSTESQNPEPAPDAFRSQANAPQGGLLAEFWQFLKYNKKWWLLPILAVMLLLGLLVFLGGSGAAPFIYTLF